jgi:hypothetical protein
MREHRTVHVERLPPKMRKAEATIAEKGFQWRMMTIESQQGGHPLSGTMQFYASGPAAELEALAKNIEALCGKKN